MQPGLAVVAEFEQKLPLMTLFGALIPALDFCGFSRNNRAESLKKILNLLVVPVLDRASCNREEECR